MSLSRVVDMHAHPVGREVVRDQRNLHLMADVAGSRLNDDTATTLLDRMAAGGIQLSCLMGPNPYDGTSLTNEMVHGLVSAHPREFIGFAGVDPCRDGAPQTRGVIERASEDSGFRGVGEIGGADYLTPEWEVVWNTCTALQVPVLIHAGIPLPSMLLRYGHPFLIDELAHRHPGLRIIAVHAGVPWVIETIATAVRHENVYLDISTLPAVRSQLVPLVLALGAERRFDDRLLFGSDFPIVDPGYVCARCEACFRAAARAVAAQAASDHFRAPRQGVGPKRAPPPRARTHSPFRWPARASGAGENA